MMQRTQLLGYFLQEKLFFLLTTRPREAIVKRDDKKFTVFCSVAARTKKSYRNTKLFVSKGILFLYCMMRLIISHEHVEFRRLCKTKKQ